MNLLGVLKGLYSAWMRFAKVVGRFNSRVLLSLIFYLLIFPLSLLLKIFSKDRLRLQFAKDMETYWLDRSQRKFEKDRYEKQF